MNLLISVADIPRRPESYIRENYALGENISSIPGMVLREATVVSSGEVVLIRVLLRSSIQSDEAQEKILIEISILSKLNFAHIGKLFDYFQDLRSFYIVMQRFKGGNIAKKLIKSQSFSESQCLNYMMQVFTTLDFLQSYNVAYRVLKLENILLSSSAPDAVLKFVNFYYAKQERGVPINEKIGVPLYMAPEVIRGSYDHRCDWWSAGVLMYILLSGTAPFPGKSESEIARKVLAGTFDVHSRSWDHVSPQAKDLISKLIHVAPGQRISPNDALHHPWFTNPVPPTITPEISAKYIVNFGQFKSEGKLKKAIFTYISSLFLSDEESVEQLNFFRFLDGNKNGMISRQEIEEGFIKLYGNRVRNARDELGEIFREIDVDGSGDINYHEFVTAAVGRNKLLAKQKLEKIFKTLDTNQNGGIELNELRAVLLRFGVSDNQVLQEMIKECDLNSDGQIDLNEFCRYMLKSSG